MLGMDVITQLGEVTIYKDGSDKYVIASYGWKAVKGTLVELKIKTSVQSAMLRNGQLSRTGQQEEKRAEFEQEVERGRLKREFLLHGQKMQQLECYR